MWRCVGSLFLLAPLSSAVHAAYLTTTVTKQVAPTTSSDPLADAAPTTATAPSAAAPATSPSSSGTSAGEWHMTAVTSVQARVQGDAPVWNEAAKMWLSKFGDTTELAYMNNLDTVNTASVEGALMFVQAEGINVNEQSVKCQRKNNMQYVVFYEVTIVQPTYGIKYYEKHTPPEYGEFVAMDGAKCTDEGSDLSEHCKVYYGLDGTVDVGPMVGANLQTADPRAPYPGNYWFSYPNSCAQKLRADKTDECRAEYPGGLCAMGVQPDGDNCTFSYKILGYLNIDDLVGITEMGYGNYTDFCADGGVEFKASNTGSGFDVEEAIEFWQNPSDKDANAERAEKMVAMYNELVSNGTSSNTMPLPSVETLTAANPKCYLNSAKCASAEFGCSRSLYSQICSICTSSGSCDAASSAFPDLKLPTNSSSSSSSDGSSASRLAGAGSADGTAESGTTTDDASSPPREGGNTSSGAIAVAATSSIVALVALVTSSLL
ncbi:unnamed protein product [Hyaloperonospora brassicae]|uniref:Uncharacterized protein n=1 Tax=Hyaloperonospora brassicae TaxID=162125 RepID=A0AAV0ULB0_HYABA|nr:unnamed protein product [Hyaloperonospora brassicae]